MLFVLIGLSLAVLLNVWVTFSYSRKIIDSLKINDAPQPRQEENDIHYMLNNRLLDIQNRRYSVQRRIRRDNDA